ncbi:MAG: ROK family protein [Saprospiraceae bacterium]|nr:ROK family protein [Saprospiraceae bacterium]
MEPLWGIDLGGTKIEGVIIASRKNPTELTRLRVPTEQEGGYDHIIEQIGKLIEQMKKESGLNPPYIGMGTPGVLEPSTQTMKNCNTTSLLGKPLKKDLEDRLGITFRMANDANCFAVAETNLGVVKDVLPDADVVFGIIMGTGVGGGLVVDGKAIYGKQGIAGEWGHNFLDESGGPCYCGKVGCVETILSGPGLERFYASRAGEKRKLKDIINRAREASDPHAVATMERLIYFFGKGVAYLINIIDPDAIILGGGLGNIDELYTRGVKEVEKHVFNARLETLFLRPKLGDSAGVFGAALL